MSSPSPSPLPEPYLTWEQHHQPDVQDIYNKYFKCNRFMKITYNDFVIYCYQNSSHHLSTE